MYKNQWQMSHVSKNRSNEQRQAFSGRCLLTGSSMNLSQGTQMPRDPENARDEAVFLCVFTQL